MDKLNKLTGVEQIKAVKEKRVKVIDIVNAHIKQIKKDEPYVHAWAYLDEEKTIENARRIDKLIDHNKFNGTLFGLPVGIKDVFNTLDMPTQMGSVLWKNFHPGNDARVVSLLREEGAIFPGKTVSAEFAVHAPGPTQNPFKKGYMVGTSSSGSAAAVATNMVPWALGTQTAGSTLRPASYCGIYGFKPTFGLLPRTGVLKTTDTLDHVGLLARSLEDIETMFHTIRVRGEDYPFVHKTIDQSKHQPKKAWKVGFVKHPKWGDAEDYAKESIEKFINKLANKANIHVKEDKLPSEFNEVHEIHERIYDRCLAYYFKKETKKSSKLSSAFYDMVKRGKQISLSQYTKDTEAQESLTRELDRWFERYDIVLTLTTGGEAMKGLDTTDRPDSCLIWTFCGVPSMSVPLFTGPLGLPFGLQVVAKKYHDLSVMDFVRDCIHPTS